MKSRVESALSAAKLAVVLAFAAYLIAHFEPVSSAAAQEPAVQSCKTWSNDQPGQFEAGLNTFIAREGWNVRAAGVASGAGSYRWYALLCK